MIMSTPKQRQMLGFLRKQMSLNDITYRELLYGYGVNTSKELTYDAAQELLNKLKREAKAAGLYKPKIQGSSTKYDNLAGRCGMATPAQLRKIDVMWKNISNQKTNKAKENALNVFIERITGKQRLNFLTQNDVRKIIKAIEVMNGEAQNG